MNPIDRKAASELRLQSLDVPVNQHLPMIEAEGEVTLRHETELMQRLIALWAVVGTAMLRGNNQFRDYIVRQGFQSWLSAAEQAFLFADHPTHQQLVRFSWQLEALYFLCWCAGLVDEIQVPAHESSVDSVLHLFPGPGESPSRLQQAIRIRDLSEILDWSDLIYRLHWAVRDAHLKGSAPPENVNGGVIQEWHRAVNWMTLYDQEDDWDHVGTDT